MRGFTFKANLKQKPTPKSDIDARHVNQSVAIQERKKQEREKQENKGKPTNIGEKANLLLKCQSPCIDEHGPIFIVDYRKQD